MNLGQLAYQNREIESWGCSAALEIMQYGYGVTALDVAYCPIMTDDLV